jgi:hypothetical protein
MSQLQGRGQDLGQEPALPLVCLVRPVRLARRAHLPGNRRMRSVSG